MAQIIPTFDRKKDQLWEIIEWLYIHEFDFENATEWRIAFLNFLKEVLE